ncbi:MULTISPECIES: LPXTG cell wall anchor domain-containing protein [unclassified Leucobacter]|uniref:LPXTG cell wall anchor domain-containing protein n=1 Tax=unclassified Leucobacter TaxID=2621730 RepID=UPI003019DF7E
MILDTTRKTKRRAGYARSRVGRKLAALALAGLMVAGVADAASANSGGGGVPGSGHGSSGAWQLYHMTFDAFVEGSSTGYQGVMGASTEWFINNYAGPNSGGTPTDGYGAQDSIRAACSSALAKAEARGGNQGRSRVVGIMWAGSATSAWASYSSASSAFYQQRWDQAVVGAGYPGIYTQAAPYMAQRWSEGLSEGGSTPAAVCLALNQNEPPQTYALSVTTDQQGGGAIAGTAQPVHDLVHTSAGASTIRENVTARVVLNWDGVETGPRSVAKDVPVPNVGTTRTPDFTPADFGWQAWPQGGYWFDVQVGQQGMMAAPVDTPDRDPRESWTAPPVLPAKALLTSDGSRELAADEVLVAGQSYIARVRAFTNGYESSMTISDIVHSRSVWFGGVDADNLAAGYVLNDGGQRVPAEFAVSRTGSGASARSTVTATIRNVSPGAYFTMYMPTFMQPTGADYSVPDDSRACYTASQIGCINGNSEVTRKVSPKPDKVWVLDEDGALIAADPDHTDKVAADGKVFLPGDAVTAVVNGRIPAHVVDPYSYYRLGDVWTKAAQYVDFSDVSKAKVFVQDNPLLQWVDRSAQFDFEVVGTVTTATARAPFPATTAGLEHDRKVKLVISGNFRTDYDTDGATVALYNEGWEEWNNERVPTNTPPVFTWTPDPSKQVIGSAEESGDKTHDNIDGLVVFPGQKVEYSIGVDLRIPGNTARGVKSLVVKDKHDPQLRPDRESVQFWDSRDPLSPRPVPRSAYKLAFQDKEHSFTVTFTQAWLDANVNVEGANSEWVNRPGWLTMRFTGTVLDTAPPGSAVRNQAFQIINGVSMATEIPEVTIPSIEPDKVVLSTDGDDIDGKVLMKGDKVIYRLTLDGGPARSELAYNVHKLGIVDDYDERYLDVESVTYASQRTGVEVPTEFNQQVASGKVAVFAKTVDHTNAYGELIPGDPQPEDLFAYDREPIKPHSSPIINQDLLGDDYWIIITAVVTKEVEGDVIKNQAVQNIQNTHHQTRIVSNPLAKINPEKDVVVDAGGADSINGQEIPLHSLFNYRLNSSTIPANRAYGAKEWAVTDKFNREFDAHTGQWAIYAQTDLYDGEKRVARKGDPLQDADSEKKGDTVYFDVVFDEETYTMTATATPAYLELVNSRGDLAQAWSLYVQMERIKAGERIENTFVERYNGKDRPSNVVHTFTLEPVIPAEPAPPLAKTGGAGALGLAGGAVLLLGGGVLAVVLARRSKTRAAVSEEVPVTS